MSSATRKARRREDKRQRMNDQIDSGGEYGAAARQAKKALSIDWRNRAPNVQRWHKPEGVTAPSIRKNARIKHCVVQL